MIRTAVVGFGFMGRTHAARIIANPGMQLAAIVDRSQRDPAASLSKAKGNFSHGDLTPEQLVGVPAYATLEECLDQAEIDAVSICLPTLYHYDTTKLCLSRGKHVLVEKPFVLDVEKGRELIALAHRNQVVLMVALVVRFMPEYLLLKEAVEDQRYGKLEFITTSRLTGKASWGTVARDPRAREASGGGLFELLVHDIDFVHWLAGEPRGIRSSCISGPASAQDFVTAHWKYATGLEAVLTGGMNFHSALPFEARYIARFEHATLEFASTTPGRVRVATDNDLQEVALPSQPDCFQCEMNYFAECVSARKWPDACTPESALRSIELAHQHLSNSAPGVNPHDR